MLDKEAGVLETMEGVIAQRGVVEPRDVPDPERGYENAEPPRQPPSTLRLPARPGKEPLRAAQPTTPSRRQASRHGHEGIAKDQKGCGDDRQQLVLEHVSGEQRRRSRIERRFKPHPAHHQPGQEGARPPPGHPMAHTSRRPQPTQPPEVEPAEREQDRVDDGVGAPRRPQIMGSDGLTTMGDHGGPLIPVPAEPMKSMVGVAVEARSSSGWSVPESQRAGHSPQRLVRARLEAGMRADGR